MHLLLMSINLVPIFKLKNITNFKKTYSTLIIEHENPSDNALKINSNLNTSRLLKNILHFSKKTRKLTDSKR